MRRPTAERIDRLMRETQRRAAARRAERQVVEDPRRADETRQWITKKLGRIRSTLEPEQITAAEAQSPAEQEAALAGFLAALRARWAGRG